MLLKKLNSRSKNTYFDTLFLYTCTNLNGRICRIMNYHNISYPICFCTILLIIWKLICAFIYCFLWWHIGPYHYRHNFPFYFYYFILLSAVGISTQLKNWAHNLTVRANRSMNMKEVQYENNTRSKMKNVSLRSSMLTFELWAKRYRSK